MKIAMMTNNYKPFIGGVPISIERLSNGLQELGHEVVVFAPTYKEQEEEASVFRYRSRGEGTSENGLIPAGVVIPDSTDSRINQAFERERFDVIHVHHPILIGHKALRLSRKYDIPIIFTYHTRYEQYLHYAKPFHFLLKDSLVLSYINAFTRQCDMVLAPTELIKEHLRQTGCESEIAVLPTGLQDASFDSHGEPPLHVRKQFLGNKQYLFCTVSRLAKEKNIDFLLNSLALFKEREGDCFRLLMIGDGPERDHLLRKTAQLSLQDNICFLGKVPNEQVLTYCRAADLFLFASKSETQGMVLTEAMASRVPVVAVEASGAVDVVRNGYNGFITAEKEVDFAGQIQKTIHDRELLLSLKEGAYETACQYRESEIAKRALYFYRMAFLIRQLKGPCPRSFWEEKRLSILFNKLRV